MSDGAFLEAIFAAPDDDAPRLVYADVLTERGDPRGELIVLQCARARRSLASMLRERELIAARTAELQRDMPHVRVTFARGFIDRVDLVAQSLRPAWQELVREPIRTITVHYGSVADLVFAATHPTVQTVAISHQQRHFTNEATLDAATLRDLSAEDTTPAWETANLPHEHLFPALLSVSTTNPSAETFERLRSLPKLRALTAAGSYGIGVKDAARIGELAALTRLVVTGWPPDAMRAVLESTPPPKLRELEVRRSPNDVVTKIAALPQLELLGTNLRLDAGLSSAVGNLRALFLDETPAGGFFERFLGAAPRLERVKLNSGSHRPTLADQLPTFPALPALREVDLASFTVDEDAARALVRQLPHVPVLDIRKSYFHGAARDVLLAQWPTARFAW